MKKVLIWDISFKLANVGGPAGYLYNLHEFLKDHPNPQIVFLSDLYPQNGNHEKVHSHGRNILKRIVRNNVLTSNILEILNLTRREYENSQVELPQTIDLNEYSYIHFHQTNDVTRHSILLANYSGKTILTTHCPCPRTEEILAVKPKWYRFFKQIVMKQEVRALASADYLMFPCRDAREPYEKEPMIKRLFNSIEDKFFYVPTSILDLHIDKFQMQKISEFGIPEDAFVIAYFGRHNYIKGYDILKKLGQELLDKYPKLYFLCAGKGDIIPLNHPRWIELGFVSNIHELLAQCSIYVLPNRETYFDLVVLEVLRAGKPLVMAENGGNRYFKKLSADEISGLTLFNVDNFPMLCDSIIKLIDMSVSGADRFEKFGKNNRQLWEKHFTMATYVDTYCKQIEGLQ